MRKRIRSKLVHLKWMFIALVLLTLVSCFTNQTITEEPPYPENPFDAYEGPGKNAFYGECNDGIEGGWAGCMLHTPLYIQQDPNIPTDHNLRQKKIYAERTDSDGKIMEKQEFLFHLLSQGNRHLLIITSPKNPDQKIDMQWRYRRSYFNKGKGGTVLGGWVKNIYKKKDKETSKTLFIVFPVAKGDGVSLKLSGNFLVGDNYSDFITISDQFPELKFESP